MRSAPHQFNWTTCRNLLLLAAAYALTGRMAMLLAVPPGYAMALYPPAGIALGIVLAGGYALAPGVALGSFVLNLWIGWETSGHIGVVDMLVPAMLGMGATLQALCGVWLVRRFVGYPSSLSREWHVLLFLVLGGPVASLVNASIGTGTLLQAGIINKANFLSNWATWWVGDTLGVLVITPLLLIAFGEPRSIWRSRRFNVGIPLLVSLFVVVTAFIFVRNMEQERLEREFREEAVNAARSLQTRLNFHSEMVKIMERLFASSDHVSPEDFHIFVSSAQARYPTLQALEWIPRVHDSERSSFEAAARTDGDAEFAIKESTADGSLVPATRRDDYFPVFYVEPRQPNLRAIGFDLGSSPSRRKALEKARDTGLTVASEPLDLVQTAPGLSRAGELLVMAVYERGAKLDTVEQRRKAFRGIVLSVVRIDDLIKQVFPEAELEQIRFRLFDAIAPGNTSVIYDSLDTLQASSFGVSQQARLLFGERQYNFIAQPSAAYWDNHRSWAAWWMLVGGLFFTSLLGMYLLITSAQAYRVDALVKRRTQELLESQGKLRENATLLQAVMDSIPSCIYVRDTGGLFLYVNKQYERIFRRNNQKVISRTLDNDQLHAQDIAAQSPGDERLRRMEITTERDGARITHLLERAPLRNEKGDIYGICGVATDITQNKLNEEDMQNLNRQLEATTSLQNAILNSANFSIISTDVEGVIQVFNVGAQRMLGYSADEMVGRRTPEIIHDRSEVAERAAVLSHELGRAIAPGFEVFVARARSGVADEHEWTYVRKDGSRIPVMLSVTGLRNDRQELTGFLGVAYDLTERKKIESMKSEFISTVSHELRTPLTAIHGALDLLAAGVVGEIQPDIRTLLDIANEDCNRLVRLVNDILDAEKIESGNMHFHMVEQNLRPQIERAVFATQPYADQYHVRFALPGDEADCLVKIDADRIVQVLINLLSNAAKYSPPGGVVEIRVMQEAGRVRVAVIDHGEGVPEKFHDRIFQKFAQADSSDSRKKGGTGLGLSICKAIIEKHFGYIDFRSTPGAGSEFFFELNLVAAKQAEAA